MATAEVDERAPYTVLTRAWPGGPETTILKTFTLASAKKAADGAYKTGAVATADVYDREGLNVYCAHAQGSTPKSQG